MYCMISTVVTLPFLQPLHVDLLNTWDLLLKSSHAVLDTDVMTIGTDEHIADDKNLQPVTEKVG